MAKIEFIKEKDSIEVSDTEGKSLMQILLDQKIPVASSCGGEGICSKCVIEIVEGIETLEPANQREVELSERLKISGNRRVSCQTKLKSDSVIKVDTEYW